MSLETYYKNRWLRRHTTNSNEIKDLLKLIDRDLEACQIPNLPLDWKHNIAFNAALQCATVALFASGYKAEHNVHHYRTILALEFSIGWDKIKIDQLDTGRTKRAVADLLERVQFHPPKLAIWLILLKS